MSRDTNPEQEIETALYTAGVHDSGTLASMIYEDQVQPLENEVSTLHKALAAYQRERDRFKHNIPEITGAYFLAGGYGDTDDNLLPEFVEICPAYGAGWTQVYQKTNRTISTEGS